MVATNFVVFASLGTWRLFVGHPHEDAFILFRYVENLLAGHGISYAPPYLPAEGATDFLWLMLLTAVSSTGLDVALSAVALNALGAAVWTLVLVRAGSRYLSASVSSSWLVATALVIPFTLPALSSYGGFSTMLFSALAAWLFYLALVLRGRSLGWIPVLGLIAGLFRPDGLVFALGFCLLGLFRARRDRALGPYFGACGGAALAGAGYFAWRFTYFGHLLPLPLYVKQYYDLASGKNVVERIAAESLPFLTGIGGTTVFLVVFASPLLLVLALYSGLGIFSEIRSLFVAASPVVAHGLALAVAHLSQNFHSRFHGPEFAVAFVLWAAVSLRVLDPEGRRRVFGRFDRSILGLAHAVVLAYFLFLGVERLEQIWSRKQYIDVFPEKLAAMTTGDDAAMITEAGRMAYWTSMRTTDLVGLNTPRTALAPMTREEIAAANPAIVFFHPTHLADYRAVVFRGRPWRRLEPEALRALVAPVFGDVEMSDLGSYSDEYYPVRVAAMSAADYLLAHSESYQLYAVRYQRRLHVYGFHRERFDLREIEEALTLSYRAESYRGYLPMKWGE